MDLKELARSVARGLVRGGVVENMLSIVKKRLFLSIVRQGLGGLMELEPEVLEVSLG
jgi:hypothetical protein